MIDRCQLGLAERGRQRHVTIDGELCGFSIEDFAIVKLDAGPQFDGDFLAVGGGVVGQRQLRHDG
jgi:hypothetical protein